MNASELLQHMQELHKYDEFWGYVVQGHWLAPLAIEAANLAYMETYESKPASWIVEIGYGRYGEIEPESTWMDEYKPFRFHAGRQNEEDEPYTMLKAEWITEVTGE